LWSAKAGDLRSVVRIGIKALVYFEVVGRVGRGLSGAGHGDAGAVARRPAGRRPAGGPEASRSGSVMNLDSSSDFRSFRAEHRRQAAK